MSENNKHSLEIRDLSCVRGDRRLFEGMNLQLNNGDLLFVKGHNGSGKSTFLRALAGLLLPESGGIFWQGENIRDLREDYTRDLLYLGHLNGIKEDLTALENLRISATIDGFSVSEDEAWDTLQKIGLRAHEDVPTKYLSQGQKRRVALARLLVNKSVVWVLDEPFTALDVAAVDMLQQVMKDHLDQGGIVIFTTHQAVDLMDGDLRVLELGKKNV